VSRPKHPFVIISVQKALLYPRELEKFRQITTIRACFERRRALLTTTIHPPTIFI
jgi:hypothetical protein